MTPAQDKLYWREWAAARRALPDSDRHDLHAQALGVDKSHKHFTNAELDKVLGVFRAISRPDSLHAQVRQIEQPRTRLLHRIRDQIKCLSLFVEHPTAYAQAILRSRFHTEFLEDLSAESSVGVSPAGSEASRLGDDIPDSELAMMRNTLGRALARTRKRWNESGEHTPIETEHEMCLKAGVQCFRPKCAQCRAQRDPGQSGTARTHAATQPTPELETNPF